MGIQCSATFRRPRERGKPPADCCRPEAFPAVVLAGDDLQSLFSLLTGLFSSTSTPPCQCLCQMDLTGVVYLARPDLSLPPTHAPAQPGANAGFWKTCPSKALNCPGWHLSTPEASEAVPVTHGAVSAPLPRWKSFATPLRPAGEKDQVPNLSGLNITSTGVINIYPCFAQVFPT